MTFVNSNCIREGKSRYDDVTAYLFQCNERALVIEALMRKLEQHLGTTYNAQVEYLQCTEVLKTIRIIRG